MFKTNLRVVRTAHSPGVRTASFISVSTVAGSVPRLGQGAGYKSSNSNKAQHFVELIWLIRQD